MTNRLITTLRNKGWYAINDWGYLYLCKDSHQKCIKIKDNLIMIEDMQYHLRVSKLYNNLSIS